MLRPETEKLWNYLKECKALAGFVLIGGTALSLQIAHRLSEDLDFIFLDGKNGDKLPRHRLDALLIAAHADGFHFARNDKPASIDEMEIAGMDLHDYQQDFLVNGAVKVTFFAPDPDLARITIANLEKTARVATLDELFKSKAIITAQRSKSRDWFDLYTLLKHHGYSIFDYYNAFKEADVWQKAETGMYRLCSGIPQLSDEGFTQLMEEAPTLQQMTEFFREQRDRYEIETARQAHESSPNPPA